MNAMPPMVRHESKAAPGPHGRSHTHIDQRQGAFDRFLDDIAPGDATMEARGSEVPAIADEASATHTAEGKEAESRTTDDPLSGFFPLLRIVLTTETTTGRTPSEDIGTALGGPTATEVQPEAPHEPEQRKPAAPDTTASPVSAEPRRALDPQQPVDAQRPSGARPAADARSAPEASSVIAEAQADTLRRTQVTVMTAATPQAAGAVSAASPSLSLLSRLNLVSAHLGRSTAAQIATTAGRQPADINPGAADVVARDTGDGAASPMAGATADDEAGDRSANRIERPDGNGRAADRAAPIPTSLPQTGQPSGIPMQIVQALASNAAGSAPLQKIVATGHVDVPPSGTVQSLKIELRPHELGQVTAKLSMADGQLSIEIEVDTVEAHRKLANESDTIIKALRAHGIAVDQVTIQPPPQSNGAARGGAGAETQAFAGQDTRDSGNSGNPAGGNRQYDSPDREHGQQTRSTGESHSSSIRSAGGVYI